MSYSFLNRYCEVKSNLFGTGIITFTGWITQADETCIVIIAENYEQITFKREDLTGSIVVLEEQKEGNTGQMLTEQSMCIIGKN